MRKVVGRGALQAHRRGNDNAHRRTRTRPVLQTSILPRVAAEYQPGKLATTETRQALIFGSLRAALVLGASGPERATTFVPTSTATVVVDTARPFTTISVVAECRSFGPAAKEPLGACAGDSTGRDVGAPVGSGTAADSSGPVVGAPVGSGAGAVSEELAGFGATTGGADARRSPPGAPCHVRPPPKACQRHRPYARCLASGARGWPRVARYFSPGS